MTTEETPTVAELLWPARPASPRRSWPGRPTTAARTSGCRCTPRAAD